MARQTTKSWRTVRAQRPLNEDEVARHRRAFDAEAGLVKDDQENRDSRVGKDDPHEDNGDGEA